jgi:hypothetical protein
MDNESEVAYVRAVMENLPTLVRSSVLDRRQAPKRGRSLGHTIHWCVVSTPEETRCKAHILTSHKMDARNGETRQRLSRQREEAARPYASAGRMAQEANASL